MLETMSQTTAKKHLPDTSQDKENMTSQLSECGSIRLDYTNCAVHPEFSSYSAGFSTDSGVPRGGSSNLPPPEIPKALQNRAKINPIVKTVKNCLI